MAKKDKDKKEPFIFNDETIANSYGFKILTSGINQKRFKKNPVMLDGHYVSNWAVMGKWENIKVEKGLLIGDPVFDLEDKDTEKIAGKVERGYINSCSMGILFDPDDFEIINNELVLTKCELMEVSIVAVPSNANAVRLYASTDKKVLTEKEVKELCLSATKTTTKINNKPKKENTNMKITLTTAVVTALNLGVGVTEIESEELNQKIIELASKKTSAEVQLQAKLDAEETAKLTAIELQVENAIKAGQITADKKEAMINLGIANPGLLTDTLSVIPVKKKLGATITPPTGGESTEVKTKEDFQKLSHEQQLTFKAENPDQYKQLFTIKK